MHAAGAAAAAKEHLRRSSFGFEHAFKLSWALNPIGNTFRQRDLTIIYMMPIMQAAYTLLSLITNIKSKIHQAHLCRSQQIPNANV